MRQSLINLHPIEVNTWLVTERCAFCELALFEEVVRLDWAAALQDLEKG